MTKRQIFYKSKKWEKFVRVLRLERMTPEGVLLCEHCGKAITSKYDCIAHHVEELTEENVENVEISLNPENIKLVHFGCHNKIHKRFRYSESRCVYIVYGAPCAGKTSWVNSVSDSADLIVDVDRIWAAVRSAVCGPYEKPGVLKPIVFDLRDRLLDDVQTRRGKWKSAYIIGGYPLIGERERLQERIGADKLIFIDTPEAICMERAAAKSPEWCGYVSDWFRSFTPDDTDPPGSD